MEKPTRHDSRRSKEVHQEATRSGGREAIAVVLNQPPTALTDERGLPRAFVAKSLLSLTLFLSLFFQLRAG